MIDRAGRKKMFLQHLELPINIMEGYLGGPGRQ
jgi:hypothetical protein